MAAIIKPQKQRSKWPLNHQPGGPCLCNCKVKYIQPEKPNSFKPIATYKPPECKLNDDSTYKMSYDGFDSNMIKKCRGSQIKHKQNLSTAGGFTSDTTHKMSYGAWPGYKPPKKVHPCDHKLLGDGPMSDLTTQKHDYTAKPIQHVEQTIHPGNLGFSEDHMEKDTTANMSYRFPDLNRFEPATPFKPQTHFKPQSTKMDDKTTHKLSYRPQCPPEREDYPWTKKEAYRSPTVPFEGHTTYNGSYLAPGEFVEECVEGPGICYCESPCLCCDGDGNPPKAESCPTGCNPSC